MVRSIIFFLLFPPPSIFSFSLSATVLAYSFTTVFSLSATVLAYYFTTVFVFRGWWCKVITRASSDLQGIYQWASFIDYSFYPLIIIGCWERYFCFTSDI